MIKELLASASATRLDSSYPPASTPVTRLPELKLPACQYASYPHASTTSYLIEELLAGGVGLDGKLQLRVDGGDPHIDRLRHPLYYVIVTL